MWDAAEYLKYSDERARPFVDLLSQVPGNNMRLIVDLGCGAGNLTRILADRWPEARVIGVDSSEEMLAEAVPKTVTGRLKFVRADIENWSADATVDLIISNAALHWVDDHAAVLSRLTTMLAPRGTLAVQMPNRFGTPSQIAIEQTVADPRWASVLQGVGLHRESVRPLLWYVHHLHDLGYKVNAWETTYFHVMTGKKPVLQWLKGTALRPLIERLQKEQQTEFLQSLGLRLEDAYPAREGVTVFPMPRLFFVATRQRR